MSQTTDATPVSTDLPDAAKPTTDKEQRVRIYEHSNMCYWWIVWFYGYCCALLTLWDGRKITLFEAQELYVYSSPWLGTSFVAVLVFVALVTNVKARGIYSIVLFLLLFLLGLIVHMSGAWQHIGQWMPRLLIYMNLAFYVSISTALFAIWLAVFFVIDRLSYWEFTPGQATHRVRIGEGTRHFDTRGMVVARVPNDIIVHNILGLRFLGLGTGDLRIITAGAIKETFTLENIWCVNRCDRKVQELITITPAS